MSDASQIVGKALAHIVAGEMSGFFSLVAEDAVIELPFAPPGWPRRLEGRAALMGHLQNFADHLTIQEVADFTLYETTEPDVAITEYKLKGVRTKTQEPYEVQYLQVLTVKDGYIVRYRDYWNPLLALELAPDGFQ